MKLATIKNNKSDYTLRSSLEFVQDKLAYIATSEIIITEKAGFVEKSRRMENTVSYTEEIFKSPEPNKSRNSAATKLFVKKLPDLENMCLKMNGVDNGSKI